MVLGGEDKRDGITDGGINLRGGVGEARGTDLDLDVGRGDGGGEGGEGNGSDCEAHVDCL